MASSGRVRPVSSLAKGAQHPHGSQQPRPVERCFQESGSLLRTRLRCSRDVANAHVVRMAVSAVRVVPGEDVGAFLVEDRSDCQRCLVDRDVDEAAGLLGRGVGHA